MILLLHQKAIPQQVQDMLEQYEEMIKIVVDIRRRVLSGGGEMHADCETVLLDDGSEQEFGPGNTGIVPPGHDAWVVGNENFVAIDFTGGKTYAKK